ncbi:MAG: hypothetical protein FWG98_10990 [Candidatus Cloacimonetes bacterium]|nr:hypothetical protein [Candidatus Cloacimonadota bacterium]
MKKIILFSVFLIIFCVYLSAERMVISIPFVSHERVQEYITLGYDIAQVIPSKNEVYLVVNAEQKLYFESKYSTVKITFTETEMKANLTSTYRSIPGYQTNEQVVQRMMELAAQFPGLCKMIELGPSQGKIYYDAGNENYADFNHTIWAVKLSNDVTVFQDKPNYYFMGNIHAREPLTAEVCLAILEDLLFTYRPTNQNHPLNNSQIWIVPIINPVRLFSI